MAAFTMKQHDTAPSLSFVLSDVNGPVDLTGATTIKFLAWARGVKRFSGICTKDADQVTNPGEGVYDWGVDDTRIPGDYAVEFEVTWSTGKVETFPSDGYEQLIVEPDLG